MSDERFLVTGALGCVGAWVVKRLAVERTPVWMFDLPGQPHRLRLLMDDDEVAAVHRVDGDVTDAEALRRTIAENGITHVIHLAALQVPFVKADPVRGAQVNVVGTTAVFEAARHNADFVQGVTYASSSAVYGTDPVPGGADPVAGSGPPATLYGVFKRANEGTARIYWNDHGVGSIGLRPNVVYGPGRDQGASSPPSKALLAAAVGRAYHIGLAVTLGLQYVDDVANAFILAARARPQGALRVDLKAHDASMPALIRAIGEEVPDARGLISADPVAGDIPSAPMSAVLDDVIGAVVPQTPLRDGIRRSVDLFRAAHTRGVLDVERILGADAGAETESVRT